MRTQIEEEIDNAWHAEKCLREDAKPDPLLDPPEVTRYFKTWKRAYQNRNGRRADHHIAEAYEAWAMAVSDSEEAARILGLVHDGIEEFDGLPKPGCRHVRTTKREIVASTLSRFRANPEWYLAE